MIMAESWDFNIQALDGKVTMLGAVSLPYILFWAEYFKDVISWSS